MHFLCLIFLYYILDILFCPYFIENFIYFRKNSLIYHSFTDSLQLRTRQK